MKQATSEVDALWALYETAKATAVLAGERASVAHAAYERASKAYKKALEADQAAFDAEMAAQDAESAAWNRWYAAARAATAGGRP